MDQRPVRPIPLTVGSVPALDDIIGRDLQVDRVLGLLDARQTVLLTGDRRVGKTSIARLVEAHLSAAGRTFVRTSAERVDYAGFATELARSLSRAVPAGPLREELRRWELTITAGPVGAKRASQERGLDDIIAVALPDEGEPPLVLIIDEVPVLALEMERAQPGSGRELLVTLRRIRQQHSTRLAMLLLGSIGFHHVSDAAPGSVNDVVPEPVGSLDEADAIYLARCLMLGEDIRPADPIGVAVAITQAAEGIPYYIQHLVKACRDMPARDELAPAGIASLVEAALIDPHDPWNMRHYRDRITPYYGAEQAELIESMLDVYADRGTITVDELRRLLPYTELPSIPGRRALVRIIEDLERDHYLRRAGRSSGFRSTLVREYWKRSMR
ncbi:ATP-binding protein [Hoyosella sp. G463]|uniref:ATP-binding protein n=1 Tax=Lolliginicoccus lacisalsi TaxID=2742202 RepID=A0A927J975_9ACTN|nr:ATP-binding protein [Lolliginicoccus lacisalsi]